MADKKVICSICGKAFQKEQDLDRHVAAKHKTFPKISRKYRGLTAPMLKALGDEFYNQKNYKKAKELYENYLKLSHGDVEIIETLNKLRYTLRDTKKEKRSKYKMLDGPKKIEKYPSEGKEHKKAHTHVFWWLGKPPEQNEITILENFLFNHNARFIWEDSIKKHFRIFNDNKTSLHIELELEKTGVTILAHIDMEIHGRVIHNKQSRELLLSLDKMLRKKKVGHIFLLPRDIKELRRFLNKIY